MHRAEAVLEKPKTESASKRVRFANWNSNQQQQLTMGNAALQPQQNGSLTQATQSQQGSSLSQTTQPQQSTSLFQTAQPQQSTSLFGNTAGQTSQLKPTSNLFGSTLGQNSQPQATSNISQTTQAQPSNSLFGNTPAASSQPQQQAGGLFGAALGQTSQPAQQSSLFGSNRFSLFGGNKPQDNSQAPSGNTFLQANNSENRPPETTTFFGLSAYPASQLPSLLKSTQLKQSQAPSPLLGKLSMGQGNVPQQTTTVGGVKIDTSEMRGTTRFQDCVDNVQMQLEQIDQMIRKQEEFCRGIQAFVGKHEENISSLGPDVEHIRSKAEEVESVLAQDAHAVEAERKAAEADRKDFDRCERIVENLKLPPGYHTPSATQGMRLVRPASGFDSKKASEQESYDTDLIGNYFLPLTSEFKKQLDAYASSLSEIEGHMKVIEASAISQAQTLAAKRAGISGARSAGDETVRELVDTLTGFGHSILGVAGKVGECREGINELVLGKLAGNRNGW